VHLHLADYLLWFSIPVIQLGVLFAMSRRCLRHIYPYFFLYTLLSVVAEPVLFLCHYASYTAYYYAYYANLLISIVLSFAVFLDVFNNAFTLQHPMRHMIGLMFWSSLAFILAVLVLRDHRHFNNGPISHLLLLTDRLLRVAQCALLLLLFFFRKYVGTSRRDFIFGVALGFGFFAIFNALVATISSRHVSFHQSTVSTTNAIGYLLTASVWLGYALWGSVQPRPLLANAEG